MVLPPTRQLKKLSEICIIDPKKSMIADFSDEIEVSFVPMKDLSQEKMFFDAIEIRKLGQVRRGYTYFENDDILLAKVTPCFENGKCGIAKNLINGIGFGSSEYIVLRKQEGVDEKYLYYFVSSKEFRKEGEQNMSGAVGLQRVKKEWLENKLFPLPPLPIQHAIVGKLDAVQEQIYEAKQSIQTQLDALDKLWQSSLSEVFENEKYEISKLNDIFDVRDGTHDSPKFYDSGYALITSKNLKEDGLETTNVKYISEEDYYAINQRSKVDKGDLLFAMIGTIGNPTIIQEEPNFAIKNVALFKPRSGQGIMEYLRYFLLSQKTINKMINESKGATQKFVGLGYLRDFIIPLPSLTEQEAIVAHLDALSSQLSALRAEYTKQLQQYDELRASTLDRAFRGELVE